MQGEEKFDIKKKRISIIETYGEDFSQKEFITNPAIGREKEIKEALIPKDYNLIVTPKEIDDLIENMSDIVASGINGSL